LKILSLFGTRPEIIRLSKIFPLLDKNFEHVMVNTNQNYTKELNSVFFEQLKIRKPDYDLKIRTDAYGKEVAEIISKSEDLLKKEAPDIILILGDTNSGLAAIPAAHQNIKIAHLEAGMRSYDPRMPEEKNRVLIDHLSTVLLPYTSYSRENLIRENIHPSKIFVVGNPIVEVIEHYSPQIKKNNILKKLKLKQNSYFLITAHRSENVDDVNSLSKIFISLEKIYKKFNKKIIFPMHPRTESKLTSKIKIPPSVTIIPPLGFFEFSNLERNAFCLITDSGTIPEESLYFKKPCVTIRNSTERPETIESGANILTGLDPQNILESVITMTSQNPKWEWNDSLGDGRTSSKVLNILRGKLY